MFGEGVSSCRESERDRGINLAARVRAPRQGQQGGAGGTFVPCKGLDLHVGLAAGECRDISGAAGSWSRVSVYESPCSGGCAK